MYTTNYFLKDKLIGCGKSFAKIEETENDIQECDYYNQADYYIVIDSDTDEVFEDYEGEIVDPEDERKHMFEGPDSEEGFDYTLE